MREGWGGRQGMGGYVEMEELLEECLLGSVSWRNVISKERG